MKYTLMKYMMTKKGAHVMEMIFDLWNHEYETGYEIKITLWGMIAWAKLIEEYVAQLRGHTYDISRWDLIIRNIKQQKMKNWIVYME